MNGQMADDRCCHMAERRCAVRITPSRLMGQFLSGIADAAHIEAQRGQRSMNEVETRVGWQVSLRRGARKFARGQVPSGKRTPPEGLAGRSRCIKTQSGEPKG